jgi:hypothetical protein
VIHELIEDLIARPSSTRIASELLHVAIVGKFIGERKSPTCDSHFDFFELLACAPQIGFARNALDGGSVAPAFEHKGEFDELRRIMTAWVEARDREAFFADIEKKCEGVSGDLREQLVGRLEQGRTLLSSADVLEQFVRWRSPDERLERTSS